MNDNNDFAVDDKRVAKLITKIIIAERNNLKSGEKSFDQMVKEIKKWIEEEAECY